MRTKAGDSSVDVTMFTWSICFTGLSYIGPTLPNTVEDILHENSLIFKIHGGFFAPDFCFVKQPGLKRYTYISVNVSEVKYSYSENKLRSLQSKMHALKQQSDSVQTLRNKITCGKSEQVLMYARTSWDRLMRPRKAAKEKKVEISRMRKELEIVKFRTKLLEQERIRKMSEVRELNQLHSNIMENNQDHGLYFLTFIDYGVLNDIYITF